MNRNGPDAGCYHELYRTWNNIKSRCLNPNVPSYKHWGAKGVKICRRWIKGENGDHPFDCFLADVGQRPSPEYTLDRFPKRHGDYKPDNVRWATRKQQAETKIGVPRPDLAAFNQSRTGIPLSTSHRERIGRGVTASPLWIDYWARRSR